MKTLNVFFLSIINISRTIRNTNRGLAVSLLAMKCTLLLLLNSCDPYQHDTNPSTDDCTPPPCYSSYDMSICGFNSTDQVTESSMPNSQGAVTNGPLSFGTGILKYEVPCGVYSEADIFIDKNPDPACPNDEVGHYYIDIIFTSNSCTGTASADRSDNTCGKQTNPDCSNF